MSLTLLASNNASTVLASSINASATTLTVNTGAGSLFPSPVAGTSFFKLTLIDAATGQLTEIVHVTARTGDVMTIERAQEGTAARVWSANDIAANMMTAGTLSYILGSFQPLDATLTALAALTGAADKLAYFNGADTAALTALTSVGRDIIGKSSVADVLTYLGLNGVNDRTGYAVLSVTNPALSSRTTIANPFGNSTPVICKAEFYHSTLLKWMSTNWVYNAAGGNSYGVSASYSEGDGITLVIGTSAYSASASASGTSIDYTGSSYGTPSPVRIHVWKVTS